MKTLLLSLLIAIVVPATTSAQASLASTVSVPYTAQIDMVYLGSEFDPVTGLLVTTGISSKVGTFGATTGVIQLMLDPATFAFTGTRDAVAADGSTISIAFQGQFLDLVNSVGTFQLVSGTGRFAGMQLSGTFSAAEWTGGVAGNSSISHGTAVFTQG